MKKVLLLLLGDAFLAILALYTGIILRFGSLENSGSFHQLFWIKVIIFVSGVLFVSFLTELYSFEKNVNKKEIIANVSISVAITYLALSAIYYMLPELMLGRGLLAIALAAFALFQSLWHICYKTGLNLPAFASRVIVLGTGPLANKIGGIILSTNHNHVLSGYIDCANEPMTVPSNNIIIDSGEGLVETVRKEKAHKIVVSLSERRGTFPLRDVLSCKMSGVEVIDAPSFYEKLTGKLLIENINPSWLIFSEGFKSTPFVRACKRALDILSSVTGLIVVLPLLPLIALAVKATSPGPVFFRQVRVGANERNFVLYKFRTMGLDAESGTGAVWAQKDDPRVTLVGRFLRKSRLDEIPQLYNVLKGDMSFVGPRPERPEFVEKLKEVIPYYSKRHFVKPGVTGWAQVKYPYGASIEDAVEKLRYDLYYLKNLSLALDLIIILETIKVVLFSRGAR